MHISYILCLALLCGMMSCKDSKDVSGRYMFSQCTIAEADKTSHIPSGALALHISRIGDDLFLVEYIGGRASGTKVSGVLKGRSIQVIMGQDEIRYEFAADYNELHIKNEEIDCVYARIKE
jgi:hypothetical protein